MEDLSFQHTARERAGGTKPTAIVGVVASGNLEVLVERVLPGTECRLEIKTAAVGFGEDCGKDCTWGVGRNRRVEARLRTTIGANSRMLRPEPRSLHASLSLFVFHEGSPNHVGALILRHEHGDS